MYTKPNLLVSLTSKEVQIAKEKNLLNTPVKVKSNSIASIIWKNMFTFFNLLNLFFAVLLLMVGSYRNMLFIFVAIFNTLIGTIQEIRAKKTRDRLKLLLKNKVSCLRNNVEEKLDFEELVLYDLVILHRGDQIPADAEVEDGIGAVDESLISGESVSVLKSKGDILLSGSFVTEGTFYARLIKVGKDSYINKIQSEAKEVIPPKSELLLSMNKIVRVVSYFIIPIGVILFYKESLISSFELKKVIPNIVAAMIGMFPSGLILLSSIALAIGVINLGKHRTLVNELHGIETLARVDTICLDKTGTITTGKMQLSKIINLNISEDFGKKQLKYFVSNIAEQNETISAIRRGLGNLKALNVDNSNTIAFNSERKWSAIYYDSKYLILGAPTVLSNDQTIVQKNIELSKNGERVLLLAETDFPIKNNTLIKSINIKPICLVTIIDQIRHDLLPTLEYFENQGVNIKVISGDDKFTVARIAKDVGIKNNNPILDNNDLENKEILNNL
ncbi:MAG: HAD-IC family P-type ATPase, partial [Christensenellaceae bacterium]|nr:HAD-IC family P-type ATPase [Christensenellaceae bacterium]